MKNTFNLKAYNYKVCNGELIVWDKKPSKEEIISEWVRKINSLYCNDDYISITIKDNVTIVFDNRNMKSGISICNYSDDFSEVLGSAIAYARLRDLDIPKEVFWK